MLLRAAGIAREAGLRYVYAGNQPGRVGDLEHTHCAGCGERLITRYGYSIQDYRLTPEGACPRCATKIPGLWAAGFEGQRTAHPFLPNDRTRLSVL
jgi:pyruvate formate lyase activating enzyme